MELVKKLSKEVSGLPYLIQISIRGIWENTWDISFNKGMPSNADIEKYLEKDSEDLAFEIFFQDKNSSNIILGVRYTEGLLVKSPKEFLIEAFKSIWLTNSSFKSIIYDLSERLTGNKNKLFKEQPTSIELGVINWWKSIGSVVIWDNKRGGYNLSRLLLYKQLDESPSLLENNKNYAAVELNYKEIPHYWLGLQISDKRRGSAFILNKKRLEYFLTHLTHISLNQ